MFWGPRPGLGGPTMMNPRSGGERCDAPRNPGQPVEDQMGVRVVSTSPPTAGPYEYSLLGFMLSINTPSDAT